MDIDKLTTVNIKKLSRQELEQAYKLLLKISLQKTDLIKAIRSGKPEDVERICRQLDAEGNAK